MFLDSAAVQVNLVKMVPKESQGHVVNVGKLVLQVFQDLKVKTAKMVLRESLVRTDFQELREKGVRLDSEGLREPTAFQEKRVPLGSVVVPAPQGLEELLENLAEMVSPEVQE